MEDIKTLQSSFVVEAGVRLDVVIFVIFCFNSKTESIRVFHLQVNF
jgi:hypothetical protein